MSVDPVVLEVARNRFAAVADEMGVVLRRTAYSPNIKERADCSAAVFVPDGEMLAQAEHIPVHLGSMPASVAAVLDRFGTDLPPGIQYAVNDPYHGGTHLNDLTLVRPVSRRRPADRLGGQPGPPRRRGRRGAGFDAGPRRHARPGRASWWRRCRPCPDGEWLPAFVEPFLDATRTPAERLGDLSAQLGANEAGAERLAALVSATGDRPLSPAGGGAARLRRAADARRHRRASRRGVPVRGLHGVGATGCSRSGWRSPSTVRTLAADFTGTARQVEGNINAVEAVTRSCLYYAVRVATDPTIPANGGCYRPLDLTSPSRAPWSTPSPRRRWLPATSRPASGSPTCCSGRWPRPLPTGCPPPPRAR